METNQISTSQATEKKRTTLVTILCILSFIFLILSFIGALLLLFMQDIPEFPNAFKTLPSWYPILAIVMNIFYLTSLVYIWKMKKMGLIVFTGLFAVDLVIDFAVASSLFLNESLVAFIIMAVILGLFWTQHKKMS